MGKVITLLSDWGNEDPYLAMMKGVILSIAPDVSILNISHSVSKFDIKEGAHKLEVTASYFPKGTIHLAVVDPGVGGKRRPIIVRTKRYYFVGPDNGLLMPAARKDGIERIVEIKNKKYMRKEISKTIHGRDIFAPAAAYLAKGVPVDEFGPEVMDPVEMEFPRPAVIRGHIYGEIVYIDGFGNVRTNITKVDMEKAGMKVGDILEACVGKRECIPMPFATTYGDVERGKPVLLIGGSGLLEVSVNEGSAQGLTKAKVGERITIKIPD